MSLKGKKIYRRRSPVKIVLAVLGSLIIIALILFLLAFYGFRKYAVYTDEGVTLEVPWLEEYRASNAPSEMQYNAFRILF